MIKHIFSTLFIFAVLFAHGQNENCTPTLPYKINTKSGMKMRSGPGTNFDVVVTVPSATKVLVCAEFSTPATFENINGHWRKVQFEDKIGFMFDGFLTAIETPSGPPVAPSDFDMSQLREINAVLRNDPSKLDSIMAYLGQVMDEKDYENLVGPAKMDVDSLFMGTPEIAQTEEPKPKAQPKPTLAPALNFQFVTEAYNYCGNITDLDPGKVWYAVYKQGNIYFRKRVELLIVRSKYSLGSGLEFDLRTAEEIQSTFLFSAGKRLDTNWHVTQMHDFFIDNPQQLYPGQKVELYGTEPVADLHNVTLFATGNVTHVGICPEMTNYKIKVTGEMHDKLIVQDLTPLIKNLGDCSMPEIYWFGDMNDDQYPDIIFVSKSESGLSFTLFVSDQHNKNVLYRKAYEWFNLNCD